MLRSRDTHAFAALPLSLFLALAAAEVPAVGAGDLVWEIVESSRAEGLEAGVERLAGQGYTVQAVVLQAELPTVLMSREGWRAQPRVASYRVLGRDKAGEVEKLAAAGFTLHRVASTRDREAIVVLSRSQKADGSGPKLGSALRSLELANSTSATSGGVLENLYSEGLVVVAALGGGKTDWLLLDRPHASDPKAVAGRPVDREVRVVAAKGAPPMQALLGPPASEGFGVDAIWSRGGGGLSLTGPKEIVAVLSRPRLAAGERPRPVAHTRLETGHEPSLDGTLVSVAGYGRELVFAVRAAPRTSYDSKTLHLSSANGEALAAWQRTTALREQLQSFAWHSVDLAWFRWDGAPASQPSGIVLIEPSTLPSTTPSRAEAHQAGRVPVPAGASALPADGGEPAAAWRAQYDAVARRDLKRAKALWTGETLARWEENVKRFRAPLGMGFSERELFESRAEDLATDPVVLGGWQKADDALVRVEATHEGARAVTDVTLRREGGIWKLASETSWRSLD